MVMGGIWQRFVDNLSRQLAFFPPTPPTYKVAEHQDASKELYIKPVAADQPKVLGCTVRMVRTSKTAKGGNGSAEQIVAAFVPYKAPGRAPAGGRKPVLTVLYSHGNAVDLGQMLPVYREMSRAWKVNVMGYDYSGYGCSTGSPSVSQTFADISAVLECLTQEFSIPLSSIVLYGQSVGSGPTSWLAANTPGLGGVVLHSPILSGVRVLKPNLSWWPAWADVFANHTLVPKIKSPVLVMHGTEDEVIDISCGRRLAELVAEKYRYPPWWATGYGHQNLEMSPEYLSTVQTFLDHVLKSATTAAAAAPSAGSGSTSIAGGGSTR